MTTHTVPTKFHPNACPGCGTFVSFLHDSGCKVYAGLVAASTSR